MWYIDNTVMLYDVLYMWCKITVSSDQGTPGTAGLMGQAGEKGEQVTDYTEYVKYAFKISSLHKTKWAQAEKESFKQWLTVYCFVGNSGSCWWRWCSRSERTEGQSASVTIWYNTFRNIWSVLKLFKCNAVFLLNYPQIQFYNNQEQCDRFHHIIDRYDCHARVLQGQLVKKGFLEQKVTRSVTVTEFIIL